MNKTPKKILYVDMDNVLVDFESSFKHFDEMTLKEFEKNRDEIPGIFSKMEPYEGAIDAIHELEKHFEIYILSTAPWKNSTAWSDKLMWIQEFLPELGFKRLILTHNKHLNRGDYLIDDREANGAKDFEGEWIPFGPKQNKGFETWDKVMKYLKEKEGF